MRSFLLSDVVESVTAFILVRAIELPCGADVSTAAICIYTHQEESVNLVQSPVEAG